MLGRLLSTNNKLQQSTSCRAGNSNRYNSVQLSSHYINITRNLISRPNENIFFCSNDSNVSDCIRRPEGTILTRWMIIRLMRSWKLQRLIKWREATGNNSQIHNRKAGTTKHYKYFGCKMGGRENIKIEKGKGSKREKKINNNCNQIFFFYRIRLTYTAFLMKSRLSILVLGNEDVVDRMVQ